MESPSSIRQYDFGVLRELRKRESLTLQDVASRAGLSASVISRIERNQTQAELDTLFRLGRVFGITAADLLSLAESRTAQKKSASHYQSGDFEFDRVRFRNVVAYHGHAKAGSRVSRPEIHQDDYEVCWVLRGSVRVQLPDELHDVCGGESIQFDAVLQHTYEALADCELIILHLPKPKRF